VPYLKQAAQRMRENKPVMQHFIGNVHIDLDGETRAFVETYILTFARFAKDGQDFDTFTGARAFDRFEKRDGEWRIAHRRAVFDWNRDEPTSQTWCLGLFDTQHPDMVMGAKAPEDMTYNRI
jgi:3-phenylpropionate/cinnamic acid dioxygenase small subunit